MQGVMIIIYIGMFKYRLNVHLTLFIKLDVDYFHQLGTSSVRVTTVIIVWSV